VKRLDISSAAPGGEPSADAGAADDVRDTLFGRYRLIRRIGKGGMAEAFLAVLEGTKGFRRKCVVKRIRPDKAGSTYFTQMFVDEARITAALHHPNIVQAYEFGEVGNLFFLTMEYLDGRNLGALLDCLHARGLLMPINMAAHVAQQVARGLHYAHKLTDDDGVGLGVIHRDVSPTNVMLLRTGEVKILDFGVAKAERALKQGATVVGKVKGKLSYMAPEQHSGKAVDLRADVFAAGVMLWEMLTGELLFSGAKGGERSRKMMRGDVPAPSTFRTKVPPELDAIVLRCLKVHPDDRYPSAGVLAEDLGAFVRSSLFDPGELAALVCEYGGDDEPEAPASESAGSGAPVVIDSHAIITREDARVEYTDLELMAATTSRERMRPILIPTPAAAGAPAAMVAEAPAQASPPALSAPVASTTHRFWPVAVALAVAIGLAIALVPRRSSAPVTSSPSVRPWGRAQITPVPAPGTGNARVGPELPSPPGATDPRSPDVGPTRAAKPIPSGRRRVRPADAKPEQGVPATSGPTEPDLKLVNPF
jgi:serine/threonine-protein kinase